MFSLSEPPLFTRLRDAGRTLIAGGGFDTYAGLPPAIALSAQDKEIRRARPSRDTVAAQHRQRPDRRGESGFTARTAGRTRGAGAPSPTEG